MLARGVELATGGEAGVVCYVEREAYPASVLAARMEEGILGEAPVWSNLGTFDGRPWRGRVRGIVAGIPCQPFSRAGKRQGIKDERWIWSDARRIIGEVGPEFIFVENTPDLIVHGLPIIAGDLSDLGYRVGWTTLPAAEVGASQLRERVWILAVADADGSKLRDEPGGRTGAGGSCEAELADDGEEMADPRGFRGGDRLHERGQEGPLEAVARIGGEDVACPDGERHERGLPAWRGWAGPSDGSEEMACPDGNGPQGKPVGTAPNVDASRGHDLDRCSGPKMACSCRLRREGAREHEQEAEEHGPAEAPRGRRPSDSDVPLADPGRKGLEGGEGERSNPCEEQPPSERDGGSMGYTQVDGGERLREGRPAREGLEARGPGCDDGLPYWPPGNPYGRDGVVDQRALEQWGRIPEHLHPAQSRVRRVAHGHAEGMDVDEETWSHRIRAVGNSVVPSCAAVAFLMLWDAMRIEP